MSVTMEFQDQIKGQTAPGGEAGTMEAATEEG